MKEVIPRLVAAGGFACGRLMMAMEVEMMTSMTENSPKL